MKPTHLPTTVKLYHVMGDAIEYGETHEGGFGGKI